MYCAAPLTPLPQSAGVRLTHPATQCALAVDSERLNAALARLIISIQPTAAVTSQGVDSLLQRRVVSDEQHQTSIMLGDMSPGTAAAFCRYKTELCRPYEENGTCKYADKCQFAHGRAELRPVIRHPKYKTDLCKTYHSTGLCPYGPRCHFIHNDDERRLHELNRAVIDQQRALWLQQQQMMRQEQMLQTVVMLVQQQQQQRAGCATQATQHLSTRALSVDSGASSSGGAGSPVPSPTFDDARRPLVCDVIDSRAVTSLARRVREAAPQLSDAELRGIVGRLLLQDQASSCQLHHTALSPLSPWQLQQQHRLDTSRLAQ